MKIIVTGQGRHGKDTVCEILKDMFSLSYTSSSLFTASLIYEFLKDKYGYKSVEDCFNDRSNHRVEWYNFICEYNRDNRARLGGEIFEKFDIYCGARDSDELNAMKKAKIVDLVIWIDASDRLGTTETASSITITKEDCHFVITNNSSLNDLQNKLYDIFNKFI